MELKDCITLYENDGIATTIDADSGAYIFVIEDKKKANSSAKTKGHKINTIERITFYR